MVQGRAALILLALLVAGLAGCMGAEDAPTVEAEPVLPPAPKPEPTVLAGSVTGQVLSVDLEPIPGVDLGLARADGSMRVATTDGDGRYTFNEVWPGDYRVAFSHPCCKAQTAKASVLAGNVTKVDLLVHVLTPAELGFPYQVQREWTGFMSCGVGAFVSATWCLVNDPNQDTRHRFNVSAGLQEIVAGFDWDPTVAEELGRMNAALHQFGCADCRESYGGATGGPGLVVRYDDGNMSAEEFPFAQIVEQAPFEWSLTPSWMGSVAYQMSFDVHWTEFYHERAPKNHDPFPPE